MVTLTPSIYKNNLKWSLSDQRKIDTITFNVINNTLMEDAGAFHTENVNKVSIDGQSYSLPVADSLIPTNIRCMTNARWVPFETHEYAKARIEYVMAEGSILVTFDKAVSNVPNVKIGLTGLSYRIDRGGSTYENYPTSTQLKDPNFSLVDWIIKNKTTTQGVLNGVYNDNTISMNPWVRKVIPATIDDVNSTTENDVMTHWNTDSNRTWAINSDWTDESTLPLTGNKVTMWPTGNTLVSSDGFRRAIEIENKIIEYGATVTRINDFSFSITWQAPVRVAYAAASRERSLVGTDYDIDNFAFVDKISSISLEISGATYDDTKIEHSYSLDRFDAPTTTLVNKSILDLPDSELLTQYTTTGDYVRTWIFLKGDDNYTDDTMINVSGNLVAAIGSMAVTDFLDVIPGGLLEVEFSQNAGYTMPGCMYDKDKNLIGVLPVSKENYYTGYKIPLPTECYYVRLNADLSTIRNNNFYACVYTAEKWTRVYPGRILQKYKRGKFTVTCDVYASWAIKNNVTVGTQAQIRLQNSTYISRDEGACVFEVKNITKRFKSNEFIYTLSLMEV